ncbi:dehydrogenase reductase sdr family member 7b [Fusarium langsethiae]|uniref:Dehydrogenase reductase sdr family member 7b n=1 Tax=Fusarium langsethiae TaxID=179993 RepID=A0A0N0DCU2_FUSLA|nr:dehydrogenase reductase sdr family member 7b [Fusarium langsethiae]
MPQLIWLVTATTSGLGAAVVHNLTKRGERVTATGRGVTERLKHLQSDDVFLLDLDVTAPRAEIAEQIKKAWNVWGRIDVLLNNAGISAPKSVEEADDDLVRNIFDVNLFGTLHVTQSILPYFREQKGGTIAFIGAGLGWGPLPFLSHYAASKAALGALVEGLAKEVRRFNVRCIIFEPGGFPSQLGQPKEGSVEGFGKYKPAIDAYNPGFEEMMDVFANDIALNVPGDVRKLSERIVDCIKGEGISAGRDEPVRVILGSDALRLIEQKCKEQLELTSSWEDVSLSTDRDGHDHVASKGMLRYSSIL